MAAGLGFKDFTTGEVLTAADVDGYLMQGVWVFASAAARDAAVTSPQEGNFAYLKDTNVTTYYTGSAWANLDTTGMTNPMTTTGDIIYSSSGSTPARLGIGSTGNVLTVSGGVPSWAAPAGGGGMTLLSTTSLSGTSVTISSISSSYNHLYIVVYGVEFSGGNSSLQWSTNISGSVYTLQQIALTNIVAGQRNTTAFNNYDDTVEQPAATGGANTLTIQIQNYANTSARKNFLSQFGFNGTSSNGRYVDYNGFINSTTAIDSFTFTTNLARTFTAGTLLMYGVK